MMQERQRQRKAARIGAVEAGAADHHVEIVPAHIAPDAVPQQFDRALVAIGRQHAGAAELQEFQMAMARHQVVDAKFARGIEAAMRRRDLLALQPIGTDHGRSVRVAGGVIDHQQMFADRIETVGVAAQQPRGEGRGRRTVLEEDAVAQALRAPDFGRARRRAALRASRAGRAARRPARCQACVRWHRDRALQRTAAAAGTCRADPANELRSSAEIADLGRSTRIADRDRLAEHDGLRIASIDATQKP